MSGHPWKGWVCGKCHERVPREDVLSRGFGGEYRHPVSYLADYCGDQPRYEEEYCGPVRFYPRRGAGHGHAPK